MKGREKKLAEIGKPIIGEYAKSEADEVDEEMPVIVDADAIVDPRAVTVTSLACLDRQGI